MLWSPSLLAPSLAACAGSGGLAGLAGGSGPAQVTSAPTSDGSSPDDAFSDSPPPTSAAPTPAPPVALAALGSYLVPAPGGSRAGDAWSRLNAPTPEQFVAHFYQPADTAEELSILESDGLQGIAHRLYIHHGVAEDVLLLEFSDDDGAESRYNGVVQATSADPTKTPFALTGPGTPVGYVTKTKDAQGDIASRSYAVVGRVEVEIFEFSPDTLDSASLQAVTAAQAARLPQGS